MTWPSASLYMQYNHFSSLGGLIQGVSVEMGQNATVNKGCQTEKIDIGDLVSKTSCYGVTDVPFRRLEGRQSTVLMDSSA